MRMNMDGSQLEVFASGTLGRTEGLESGGCLVGVLNLMPAPPLLWLGTRPAHVKGFETQWDLTGTLSPRSCTLAFWDETGRCARASSGRRDGWQRVGKLLKSTAM